MLNTEPVIILGAARSGTNFLRDTLMRSNFFSTWKCDEVPALWRYQNYKILHDELDDMIIDKDTINYIKKKFNKISNNKIVLEKTCANSLRPYFIARIFPNAKFIYIIRDGRSVVLSAEKKWKERSNILYLIKKLRYFPIIAIKEYIKQYLNYNQLIRNKKIQNKPWGPIYKEMINDLGKFEIKKVCAKQWSKQVTKCDKFFLENNNKVIKIYYEDLVHDLNKEIKNILNFLNLPFDKEKYANIKIIKNDNKTINLEENILKIINHKLNYHNYL